jgi:hypothetical protein
VFDRFNNEEMTGAEYAERKKHSFVIPDRVADSDLDPETFAVYMALSRHSDALGYVRITHRWVSDHFKNAGFTEEMVARSIGVLESKGFVTIHEREEGSGLYSLPDLMALNELNKPEDQEGR